MKIYVASSWRCERQPAVVTLLRNEGHEVYDFRNPAPGDRGFAWSALGLGDHREWTPEELRVALNHPVAKRAFLLDSGALAAAEVCVLLYPCGSDAHMEGGWAKGAGKKLAVVFGAEADPGLMDLFADVVCCDLDELVCWLRGLEKPVHVLLGGAS